MGTLAFVGGLSRVAKDVPPYMIVDGNPAKCCGPNAVGLKRSGLDVNARDNDGYTALHHAAARGDNDVILYLVSKGADVTIIARNGQTVADMANGPVQRTQPYPETLKLLEKLGSKNNHKCVSC